MAGWFNSLPVPATDTDTTPGEIRETHSALISVTFLGSQVPSVSRRPEFIEEMED